MIRPVLVLLHRWTGLAIAAFLLMSGATGAVISWDHALDEWLNPHLHEARVAGPALASPALVRIVEARDPRGQVTYVPLAAAPGESISFFVEPRLDPATGRLHRLGYNQVFVEPATGAELGRREWGAVWPVTRETAVSFLYRLHYTLHLPAMWGEDRWGLWLMGAVALVWTLDCLVGLSLTLPVRKAARADRAPAVERQLARGWRARWAPAWKVKAGGSPYRISFDLHRASGLWTWALLVVIAFTGFSQNLSREVFLPVLSLVSRPTPDPIGSRPPEARPVEPVLDTAAVAETAGAEGRARGWAAPVGAVGYARSVGVYAVGFFAPGGEHGAAGAGPATLFYDARDGRLLGDRRPWAGTAADIFVQAQLPLHSGRILGLPGRVLISLMGIVVALLSVTGIVIWWRKRAARVAARGRRSPKPVPAGVPAE